MQLRPGYRAVVFVTSFEEFKMKNSDSGKSKESHYLLLKGAFKTISPKKNISGGKLAKADFSLKSIFWTSLEVGSDLSAPSTPR